MKHLKLILLLVWLTATGLITNAQHQVTPEWLVHSTGENTWNRVTDQAIDNHGNIYQCGNFNREFGISNDARQLNSAEGVFITKTNGNGALTWIKKIEASGLCHAGSIAAGTDGHIYLWGNFRGDMHVDHFSIASPNRRRAFILKLDETGSAVWLNMLDGKFSSGQVATIPGTAGEIVFAGSFTGIAEIDGHRFNSGFYTDILVARLDETGNILQVQNFSGASNDMVYDVIGTDESWIFLTGAFEKELHVGGTTLQTNGLRDIFLIRLNSDLKPLAAKNYGGVYDDAGKTLCTDTRGQILLAGTYGGEVSLGKGCNLEPHGRTDVFLAKIKSDLEPIWTAGFGGPGNDYVNGMDINTYGDIYLTGNYYGQPNVETEERETGDHSSQVFMAKYDGDGNFRYIKSFGDRHHDFARAISIDMHNELFVAGNYSDEFDLLGEKTGNLPGESMFFSRLHECGLLPGLNLPEDTVVCGFEAEIHALEGLDRYSWNGRLGASKHTVDSTGWYIVEAIDSHGCAYTDTMFVQLNPPPAIDLGDTLYVRRGDPLLLTAPEGMQSYLWNDGSNLPFLSMNTAELNPGNYEYWVEAVDPDGCTGYDEVVVRVLDEKAIATGLIEPDDHSEEQFEVVVYPNPLKQSETLEIKFPEIVHGNVLLQVFSQVGELLIKNKIFVGEHRMMVFENVGSLSSGTYNLLIIKADIVINKKIVIL